jgi:nucleosome binding factor SPN SPT16 subunit
VPSTKPVTVEECVVPPVNEKVKGIALKETPDCVAYLHEAFSFVVKLIVVEVVPLESVPVG